MNSKSYRYEFQASNGYKTSSDDYYGDTEAERYASALADLSRHCQKDPDDWVKVEADDEFAGTTYLYRTQADADSDPDGSHADAWIHRFEVRSRKEYRVMVDGDCRATFEADLCEASAPITLNGDTTPFQTSDARHDADRAASLLNRWCDSEGGAFMDEDEDFEVESDD